MTKQTINVGTSPNDNRGDSLRASFQKINANFTELYTALGLDTAPLNLGAFEFAGSVLSTTDSSAIVIDQATTITSNLTVGGDVLPSVANGGDLGSSARPWRSLYVSNNTIFLGGTALSVDSQGNLLVGGQSIADVGTAAWNSITGKPTFASVATTGSYTDLTNRPALFSGSYADLTNKPALFSGSYADLTNKPNLAGTYQFSVAADDSTQRVISTDEVIKFIGAGGITTASDAEGNITITGSGGSLGNIFAVYNNTLVSSDSAAYIDFAGGMSVNQLALGTNDGSLVTISTDGGYSTFEFVADTGFGSIKFPDGTVQTTAWTGIANALRSETGIYIDVNLSDSTLRRWQFGEDGILTLPSVGKISNGAYDWTFGTDGALTFPNGTLKITDSVISNLNVVGDLSTGSQIQVGSGVAADTGIIISNSVTNSLGEGGPALESGSLVNVNGSSAYMALKTVNSLGGGPALTGEEMVEVSSSGVRIGVRVTNDLGDSSPPLVAFQGWTFDNGELALPIGTVISETPSEHGLNRTKYSGTFVLDPTWFAANAGNIVNGDSFPEGVLQNYDEVFGAFSFQYFGYFVPPTSANYTFRAHADETFVFWIGSKALSGYTYANKDMYGDYNGTFPEQQTQSFTIALTAGEFYPIRIQWGNSGGIGELDVFTWANDVGQANTADFTGRVFRENTGTAKIAVNDNRSIILSTDNATDNNWTFAPNGSLTLPQSGSISEGSQFGTTLGLTRKIYSEYLGGYGIPNPTYSELVTALAGWTPDTIETVHPVAWSGIPEQTWELTGYFKAPAAGTYTFSSAPDDYCFIVVDGDINPTPEMNAPAVIVLTQGQIVPIRVLYANVAGSGTLTLSWRNTTSQISDTANFTGLLCTTLGTTVDITVNNNKTWEFGENGSTTLPIVPWNYEARTFTGVPVTYGDTTLTFTVLLDNTIVNMSVAVGAGGYGPDSVNLTIPGTTFPGGTSPANNIVFNVQTFESAGPVYSTTTASIVTYVSGTLPQKYDNIASTGSVGIGAGSNHWTFGAGGSLTFPDGTNQSTAFVQGEQIFTVDTGATAYAPTAVDFNLLFVTPAIGYSETDPTSVTLPNGVPGQRLVIFNGYNLATLTVNQAFFDRDISGGVVAEFIYSGFDGLWIPLYGTNSPT